MSLHSLPLFVRMAGRPVILLGDGDAAAAKRRLLDRAGAVIVGEDADVALAIVAIEDATAAEAAASRLKARGILVNVVDRAALCDFTLPAIVDRDPVIVAIGTGGASAGLAATLRQRLETMLPTRLGALAQTLHDARVSLRAKYPDPSDRRRALASAMQPGGALDPLREQTNEKASVAAWLGTADAVHAPTILTIALTSRDPDDLTLRQARALAGADCVVHHIDVPAAILDRARADARRIVSPARPDGGGAGLTVYLEMA